MATRVKAGRRGRDTRRHGLLIAGFALVALGLGAGQAMAGPLPGVPDPGGDPNLPVRVPPPGGKLFGYHELTAEEPIHGWNAAELAEVAAGGGANTARFNITWWTVEPRMDQWNSSWWDKYKRLYDAYIARGIRPILNVAGTPAWARLPIYQACGHRRGCEYPPAEYMDGQWQQFVAEVARRFPQAAAIEVWNEPNLQGFYKPNPNPWRYAQLLVKAYDAIKAVDPSMKVLGGALAPFQGDEVARWSMKRFLDTMYAANPSVKNHMDGISFHTVWQELDYGAESFYAKFFQDVRSVSAKYGDAGIPLWITETGLTTNGSIAFTQFEQAVGLTMQYRKLMQMPDVKAMVIHTLADRAELPPTDFNYGYGMIRGWSPFTPKLSYCAFAGRVDTPDPYGPCSRIIEDYPDDDITPPDTSVTGGPSGTVANGNPAFTYTSSEPGSTFECKLDTGGWASCPASGQAYSGLGNGTHTFAVRATDAAGNTDGSPATRTWVVDTTVPDTTPPDTGITGGPSGTVTNGNPFFSYSATEPGSTFECKLDTGGWATCPASGQAYSGLGNGTHTFAVRATDAAGNTDGSPATRTWVVDTTVPDTVAPQTTVTSGPTGTVRRRKAIFAYSSSESGSTFECKLDTGGWASCPASGKEYLGLADGSHTFAVRATDAAGNTDATPATQTWTVDRSGDFDPSALRCSLRMTVLRWSIRRSAGEERAAYRRAYRRIFRNCVPCGRKITRITQSIRRADERSTKVALRKRRLRVIKRCNPCRRNLRVLEYRAARAGEDALFERYLRRHDAARRECDGRR